MAVRSSGHRPVRQRAGGRRTGAGASIGGRPSTTARGAGGAVPSPHGAPQRLAGASPSGRCGSWPPPGPGARWPTCSSGVALGAPRSRAAVPCSPAALLARRVGLVACSRWPCWRSGGRGPVRAVAAAAGRPDRRPTRTAPAGRAACLAATRLREQATWRELGYTIVSLVALWLDRRWPWSRSSLVISGLASRSCSAPRRLRRRRRDGAARRRRLALLPFAAYPITAWAGARAALARAMLAAARRRAGRAAGRGDPVAGPAGRRVRGRAPAHRARPARRRPAAAGRADHDARPGPAGPAAGLAGRGAGRRRPRAGQAGARRAAGADPRRAPAGAHRPRPGRGGRASWPTARRCRSTSTSRCPGGCPSRSRSTAYFVVAARRWPTWPSTAGPPGPACTAGSRSTADAGGPRRRRRRRRPRPGHRPGRAGRPGRGADGAGCCCPARPAGRPWSAWSCRAAGPLRVVLAEDGCCCGRASPGCCERFGHEVVAAVGDAAGAAPRPCGRTGPTSWSPTCGCRPASATRGCGRPSRCAPPTRPWRCWCSASTWSRPTPPSCSTPAGRAPASATCSRTGSATSRSSSTRCGRVAAGGTVVDPEVVRQLLGRRRDPLPGSPRASGRCWR